MKRWFLKIVVASSAVLFYIGFTMVGVDIYRLFYRPMVVCSQEPIHEPIIVQIDKSTSASSLVQMLAARHFIQSKHVLLSYIRIRGLSQQLKAGVYQIVDGESAAHFLNRVAAGDVLTESFRIIEGTTQAQVSTNLEKAIYLT